MDRHVLGDVIDIDFVVSDPATGEAVDADSTPTIEVYENNGTATMYTPTAAKRDTGTTGQYTTRMTLSSGNGFEVGKYYNVHVLATVGGVVGKAVINQFQITRVTTYFG